MPDVEMWNQLATAIIHILPTLRDVLELQALVCSGPSEVEELARPAHASPVRLFIGDSPLQGAGSVVQEVDAQLQVCLPWHQWGAEHGQLQPLAGCLAQGGLQNAGVETEVREQDTTLVPGDMSPRLTQGFPVLGIQQGGIAAVGTGLTGLLGAVLEREGARLQERGPVRATGHHRTH